jgi:hypothetical protein
VGKVLPVLLPQAAKPDDPAAVKQDHDPIPVAQRKDAHVQKVARAPTVQKAVKAVPGDLAAVKINEPEPVHRIARNGPHDAAVVQRHAQIPPVPIDGDHGQVEQAAAAHPHQTAKPAELAAGLVHHESRDK